jgi:hypothetical protein
MMYWFHVEIALRAAGMRAEATAYGTDAQDAERRLRSVLKSGDHLKVTLQEETVIEATPHGHTDQSAPQPDRYALLLAEVKHFLEEVDAAALRGAVPSPNMHRAITVLAKSLPIIAEEHPQ